MSGTAAHLPPKLSNSEVSHGKEEHEDWPQCQNWSFYDRQNGAAEKIDLRCRNDPPEEVSCIGFETPKEMAERVGIPVSNVRYLIKTGQLAHVYTSPGKRNPKIPLGAWERYLVARNRDSRACSHQQCA